MLSAGIGVAVVSWWGRPGVPGTSDTQGINTDDAIDAVLQAAEHTGIKIAFHLEPYTNRSVESIWEDLKYINERYGSSPGLLRASADSGNSGAGRLMYYVYDSYHIAGEEWERLLSPEGDLSVRG